MNMRKRIKTKFLATMMSVVMAVGCLTGCAGTKDSGEKATTDKQAVEEMTTVEEKTTANEQVGEKMANAKELIESGDFASRYMRAAYNFLNDNKLPEKELEKWNIIGCAYNALLEKGYESIAIGRSYPYVIAGADEIEELCKIYFGEMLSTDTIAVSGKEFEMNSNILYSVENNVYYITVADFALMNFETSAVEEKGEQELAVTVDIFSINDNWEYNILTGQIKVVLKYADDTKAGFTISEFEHIDLEDTEIQREVKNDGDTTETDGDAIGTTNGTGGVDVASMGNIIKELIKVNDVKESYSNGVNRGLSEEPKKAEKSANKLMKKIVADENIWKELLYTYAYVTTNIQKDYMNSIDEYEKSKWMVLSYVASAMADTHLYDNSFDIETSNLRVVEKDGVKYVRVTNSYADYESSYLPYFAADESLTKDIGYYSEDEQAYYLVYNRIPESSVSVGDYKVVEKSVEVEGFGVSQYYYVTIDIIEKNANGEETGTYSIQLFDSGSTNMLGLQIEAVDYTEK